MAHSCSQRLLALLNRGMLPYLLILLHIGLGTVLVYAIPRSSLAFLCLISSLFTLYILEADHRFKLVAGTVLALLIIPVLGVRNIFYLEVIFQISVFAALALGLNIVVGFAGLLDLGYVAFYAVGAYLWAFFGSQQFFVLPFAPGTQPSDLPFLLPGDAFYLFLLLSIIVAAVAGIILGLPVLRLRGDYLAIVTLGFGEIIRLVLENWGEFSQGPSGIANIPRPALFGLELSLEQSIIYLYYLMMAMVCFTIFVVNRLQNSRIGRAWHALREDDIACQAMGIDKTRTKLSAFALGATWAGMAGVFFAAKTTYVNPASFTFLESAIILCIVVLGGMGSIIGVILGALILILLPEYLRAVADYRMLAFGAILVVTMIFRPQGLITTVRRSYTAKGSTVA